MLNPIKKYPELSGELNMSSQFNHLVVRATLALSGLILAASAHAGDPEVWSRIRASLFQDRPIVEASGDFLRLDAPTRAEDAAVVPISIHTGIPQTVGQYVQNTWLIIDQNPSPIAAKFIFTPSSGQADIETRVRVNEYTLIRAVAELNDGSLHMVSKFVKASGGCSAPAGKDPAEALASLGKMKVRVEGDVIPGKPSLAQLMISHPNDSGLAFDQMSRNFTPAHFVREISVTYAGKKVMTAEVDISISENPNFRFYFVPEGAGVLAVEAIDSSDLKFNTAVKLDTGKNVAASVKPAAGS
jgi:sulfur-oxidizing protein SoxY